MSKREEFETWLKKWDVGHAVALPGLIDAMLNEHAHELAEKQRAWAEERANAAPPDDLSHDGFLAVGKAADLIDPEKGTGSGAVPCSGFPDNCPNRRVVPPEPPAHGGGIRCGCSVPEKDGTA